MLSTTIVHFKNRKRGHIHNLYLLFAIWLQNVWLANTHPTKTSLVQRLLGETLQARNKKTKQGYMRVYDQLFLFTLNWWRKHFDHLGQNTKCFKTIQSKVGKVTTEFPAPLVCVGSAVPSLQCLGGAWPFSGDVPTNPCKLHSETSALSRARWHHEQALPRLVGGVQLSTVGQFYII